MRTGAAHATEREAAEHVEPVEARTRTAYALLVVGVLLALLYLVHSDGAFGSVTYLGCGLYGTALTYVGAFRVPRAQRRPWWYFGAAQALAFIGDALYTLLEDVLHLPVTPSVADVAYLLEYPAFAFGVLLLVRSRHHADRAAFLDAAILSAGFIVVGWVFFIDPAADTGGSTMLSQMIAAAYPAGDLLVLVIAVRLFTGGLVRNVAAWALLGSVVSLLVADLYWVMIVARGIAYPPAIDGLYLASYVLLGFAAVHPSAPRVATPMSAAPAGITTARLVWLGLTLMVAPVTSEVARLTSFDGSWIIVLGGCAVAGLVVVRLADLVKDLQFSADQLSSLARRDGLTGVANRRTWDYELTRAVDHARETGTPLTAALIDLDRFKLYNDTFGHLSGDRVLQETAAAWTSIVDGHGFLARYGGEEFTVLLPGRNPADALPVLERIRLSVSDGQTCSIGVAAWDGVEEPSVLMEHADAALYHAKRTGRDRIVLHDGTATRLLTDQSWEQRAVSDLRTVYQPLVDLEDGRTVGWEALSRFGDQGPAAVFERAHRDGAAVLLEVAAIRSALAGWHGGGWLSVNASLDTLGSPQLLDVLPDDLSAIVIELTERDIAGSLLDAVAVTEELRARGARVAIDDYGVGSSNVQRIFAFRPDIIKLDMTIVRDLDADEIRQAVVAAIVHYAERTGSLVVAEGIETGAELEAARGLGVTLGQGYFLGRPGALDPLPGPQAAPTT